MEVTMYDMLLQLPLFQGLCQSDFTAILEKVKLHFQKVESGKCIVKQNETCNQLIFILQGEIHSESVDPKHGYVLHETFASPQVIEPYSLFGMRTNYTASYYARTDVSLMSIDKSYILTELSKYEIFELNYFNMLSNRAQTIYQKLWNSHIGTVHNKIINFLQMRCTQPAGEKKLYIRMEDMGMLIDETRINVSKALNEMQEKGLIELRRKEIYIPKLERLVQSCSQSAY